MKNVRIWFKKDRECRYISHLDLNRCMLRALHKSGIPVWRTEGFNTHPYATFPLPISLGFRGERECMDVRLEDDCYSLSFIKDKLNLCLPEGIRVYSVTQPLMKAKEIRYASFKIRMVCDSVTPDILINKIKELLSQEEIIVDKKSKKGIKHLNLSPYLKDARLESNNVEAFMYITLPAGSVININPMLIQTALSKYFDLDVYFDVTKTDMFDENLKSFE